MFEFVRTHNKWLMLGLLLLILPSFVFVGVSGYSGFIDGSANAAATVGGQRITQAEWDMAHRQASERVRQQQPDVDAKLLDSPQAKQEALDGLIQQRLLAVAAQSQHLEVSNERLKSRFERDPQLEIARTPTGAVNKAVLAAQGMTEEGFIQRYREDLRARQVLSPLQQASGHLPTVSGGLAFDALLQRRAVRVQHFNPSAFLAQVQVSDDELTAHYQKPEIQKQWQRPESAQIEYLVLEVQALKAAVTVSEADLRAFYEQNASRYNQAEERRARHILLKVEDPSKDGDQKAKAESLLTELRKAPEKFAELARQHSQDEGSAANGGDLDFFARGAMVKPFEDAVYALKAGEISPPVRSEFGWHIIKLEATRGGEVRPFEAVRAEIEESQRTQLARQRYQELAESFSTTVFEQPDSLEPAAKKLGLTIQRATVQRQPAPGQDAGPLTSAKLIEAVFSAETLRNKRNTDAVETAANQMVSARVLNHQPAAAPPLAEVKEAVRQQLRAHRAAELAKKAGAERLGKGVAGGDDGFAETQWISRAKPQGLPQPVLEAVLRAPSDKLPALVGVDQGSAGYWLVRLEQLGDREADLIPPDVAAKQVAQAWAAAEARAYLDALKRSHKVKQNAARPVTASSGS
ncbi:SurA N-terminal domain-containing protein [Inhella sp.]|uniref:SurA N-terminal domain-containing protein n=1 Tax=Inhella sp. TaxID=1921806 RepID=UPI0035AD92B4